MASIAVACRLSARAATQQLRGHGARRAFHAGQASMAAQNFNMPALSPTMTEGNIAKWRIQEGDSFVAGDVLLEIETDKAQMDVEAQDDGILAKIIQGDGSKSVQVGTRIAVTAEPGDDMKSLEMPAEDSPAPKQAEAPKQQPKPDSSAAAAQDSPQPPSQPTSSGSSKVTGGKAQKQTYPLYPSVQHLLKENGLPKEEADKIPATGPNGRLLKGDVLAYLGRIEGSYAAEVAQRLKKLSHLDLSNIKVAAPKEAAPKKPAPVVEEPVVVQEVEVEVALPVSLKAVMECQKRVQDSIGVFLPVSTFIARAAELANDDLPRSKLSKPTADELFNAVLGLDKVTAKSSRGNFMPQVTALPPTTVRTRATAIKKPDVLDFLTGRKPAAATAARIGGTERVIAPMNVFTVSVPKGDERRGRVFLERVKTVLEVEPGRLVV